MLRKGIDKFEIVRRIYPFAKQYRRVPKMAEHLGITVSTLRRYASEQGVTTPIPNQTAEIKRRISEGRARAWKRRKRKVN